MPASAHALATHPAMHRAFRGARTSQPGRLSPTASRILDLQRTAGNRAVAGAIASVQRDANRKPERDDEPDLVPGKPTPRRTTGFMGLNPGAEKEAAKLKKATKEDVVESYNDPIAEKRFKDHPAIMDFVWDDLGISVGDFDRWNRASDVLLMANPNLREQLADMMRWFNKAENGDIILDRLILSGHSNGVELWGESQVGSTSQPGTMIIERDLSAIAAVFPKAAAQVEDIMFSACFSIAAVELVVKVFPSLQTAWTYSSFSPSIAQGSGDHVAAFARATEGKSKLKKSDKKGSSALWTRQKGYLVGDPNLAAAGPLYAQALSKFRELGQPMYEGTGPDLTSEQLMPAYLAVQQMITHPGTPADRRDRGRNVMQILLRLRHWKIIRERFGPEYHARLQPAYDALGMTQPEWKSMTRKAVVAHVEAVMKALEAKPEAKSHKELLVKYLEKGINMMVDAEVIRPDWI